MDFSRGFVRLTHGRYQQSAQKVDGVLRADRERIRKSLESAKQANDHEGLTYLTHEAIPGLIEDLDRRILDGKAHSTKRIRRQAGKHGAMLARHRGQLLEMVWDFDPDTRGGESFDNADDLIVSLRSQPSSRFNRR